MAEDESWFRWTPAEIKRCRELAGVRQAELARWLGVTRQAVGYWESGHSTPSAKNLARLHQLLLPLLEAEAGDMFALVNDSPKIHTPSDP